MRYQQLNQSTEEIDRYAIKSIGVILLVWAGIYIVCSYGSEGTYDEKIAKELASAASISYCESNDQVTFTCGYHCDILKQAGYVILKTEKLLNTPFGGEAYTIFYSKSKNRIYVAFRGTNSILELLGEIFNSYSLEYALPPDNDDDDVRVEGYFYMQYSVFIRDPFLEDMRAMKKKYPDASFFITGHSLGAAKATLAALDLVRTKIVRKQDLVVYTFGSPRVGNYEFAKFYRTEGPKTYRVVNNNDMVPHFPPCIIENNQCVKDPNFDESMLMWCPYHVDEEVFYPNSDMANQVYRFCKNEDMTCSNKFSLLNTSIVSHLMYFGELIGCSKTE